MPIHCIQGQRGDFILSEHALMDGDPEKHTFFQSPPQKIPSTVLLPSFKRPVG
jgi:hypothetical protein